MEKTVTRHTYAVSFTQLAEQAAPDSNLPCSLSVKPVITPLNLFYFGSRNDIRIALNFHLLFNKAVCCVNSNANFR